MSGPDAGPLAALPLGGISLIIIVVARGETLLAAAICHHLGVNLGHGAPRFGDRKLGRLLRDGVTGRLWASASHPRDAETAFGWKLTALN